MKLLQFLSKATLVLVLLFGLNIANASNGDGLETVKIKTSAVCDMCKDTIEKALAYEKGVKSSNLDVSTKVVTVVYNPKKTTPEKIRKAITEAGYDADEIKADKAAYEALHPCCKVDAPH